MGVNFGAFIIPKAQTVQDINMPLKRRLVTIENYTSEKW